MASIYQNETPDGEELMNAFGIGYDDGLNDRRYNPVEPYGEYSRGRALGQADKARKGH